MVVSITAGWVVVFCVSVAAAVAAGAGVGEGGPFPPATGTPLDLVVLNETFADSRGAKCLDGTPPAFYFLRSKSAQPRGFVVFLEGGGWSFTEGESAKRARGYLGTSSSLASSMVVGGLLSDNTTVNPDFHDWNFVFVHYCDGSSFSGGRTNPVPVTDKKGSFNMYFRGRNNLQATIEVLNELGLATAPEFILTGGSAGGLATYMHADYVRSLVPSSVTMSASPDAGFFLDHQTLTGQYAYRAFFQQADLLWNSTASGGTNSDCLAEWQPKGEAWRCLMAQYIFPHISVRTFIINSLLDLYQLPNILGLHCLPPRCNSTQVLQFDQYRLDFIATLKQYVTNTPASLGHGVFTDTCFVHEMAFGKWYKGTSNSYTIDASVFPDNGSCPYPPTEAQSKS